MCRPTASKSKSIYTSSGRPQLNTSQKLWARFTGSDSCISLPNRPGATDYVPFYYKSLFIPYAFNRWRQRFTLYSSGFTKVTEFTSQLVMENSHFWQVGIYIVQVGFQEAMKKVVVSEKNLHFYPIQTAAMWLRLWSCNWHSSTLSWMLTSVCLQWQC